MAHKMNKQMKREKILDILSTYNLQTQNNIVLLNSIFASKTQTLRRRRRQHLHNIELLQKKQYLLIQNLVDKSRSRRVWSMSVSSQFWEKDVPESSDEFFKENFRVSRDAFEILCDKLKNLEKENTAFRKSIPLRKRVAIALYTFGTLGKYRRIGGCFGIGKSTICNILKAFSKEVWNVLGTRYFPQQPSEKENEDDRQIYEMYLLERNMDSSIADEKYSHVFELMRARFPRIGSDMDTQVDSTCLQIKVCCVLHNFLDEQGDLINDDWLQQQDEI